MLRLRIGAVMVSRVALRTVAGVDSVDMMGVWFVSCLGRSPRYDCIHEGHVLEGTGEMCLIIDVSYS